MDKSGDSVDKGHVHNVLLRFHDWLNSLKNRAKIAKLTPKQTIGQLGEDVADIYLRNRGYQVLDRNYRKSWGELDIVAKKQGVYHFVEVKSVAVSSVRQGHPPGVDKYEAEENVHVWKMKRLQKAIESYIDERLWGSDPDYVVDVVAVEIDKEGKKAKVRLLEDIAL